MKKIIVLKEQEGQRKGKINSVGGPREGGGNREFNGKNSESFGEKPTCRTTAEFLLR